MTTWIELSGPLFVQRLGWVLLHFVWQGVVIAAVWAMLRALLRAHDARRRYAVACVLLGFMAIAPLLTFGLLETRASAGSAAANGIGQTVEPVPAAVPPLTRYNSMAIPAVTDRLATALEWAIPWLVSVWCIGVGLLSLRLLRGYGSIRSVRSRQVRPMDYAWGERLAELQRRLSMSRPVLLFESALIQVPVVVGWLRPMILVPASSLSGLTPQQLELILAHELAHIRRHDPWVNLLQVLIETLLFYHPAVWWISRDVRAERELCCDDLAVAACGDRLAYARALTTLEGLRHGSAAMALGAGGGSLIERVRHIVGRSGSTVLDWRRPIGSALLGLGTLMFAAGVGCLALSPTHHVAVCRVALQPGDSMGGAGLYPNPGRPAPYDPFFIATEIEKIRSKPALYRVIKDLGLATKPEEAFQELKSRVDVRQVRDGSLFEIFVYSDAGKRSAEEGAEIANRIAEVFVLSRREAQNARGQSGITALEEQFHRQDQVVRDGQARLDQLKSELAVSDDSAGAGPGSEAETVRRLEADRLPLQASYEGMAQLLSQLIALRNDSPSESLFRQGLLTAYPDADLSKLLQDLWATQASLAKEGVSKGPDHPDCRALAAMLAQLEQTLEQRTQGILRGLEARVAAYRSQLESMDKAVREAKRREADLTARYQPYFAAKRDLENQQKVRDAILLRKLQEMVDLQIPPPANWEIADRAESSLRPVRTGVGLGLGLCAAGLATGLCGLVVRGAPRPPKL
jgi:beta-lactamase regulating signal transducer with metallopeptidase domain/uncharacterized protein involved in exopolysaccharide biosynthesis